MTLRPVTPYQFAAFRIALGAYLFIHFISLILYAPELFRPGGVLPNIFAALGGPLLKKAFVFVLIIFSLLLAVGWKRKWAALFLLYGWVCLHNQDFFTGRPGLPYIVLILLALALTPKGEPLTFKENGNSDWQFPKEIFIGAWILLALGYAISGPHKLGEPDWVNGEALFHVLNHPLAHDTFIKKWLLATPGLLKIMTWGTLALEIAFAPFALFSKIRPWVWLAMVGMQLFMLCAFDFADSATGMLMIHFFTFDSRWLKPKFMDSKNPPVIFFDGVCGLCDHFVNFVIREDQAHVHRVSPLQGETARKFLEPELVDDLDTIVLLEANKTYFKSSAVLKALKGMGGFWSLFYFLIFIPAPIRDIVYDFVARYRYNVFGKSESCRLPTPAEKKNFLN